MNNVESQISRMKSMMTYGLQTENKDRQYTTVEYQRVAADGKTYGIVREGTKFYIKVADTKKPNLVKEDFEYIGGFRNRKGNEFSSYANALKHFDMKMIDLKESTGNKTIMVESWNPEKNEYLVVEATNKMKAEINRQRQIMENASNIMEKKSCSCEDCACASEAKYEVLPKGKGGDIFTEAPKQPEGTEGATTAEKNNIGKAIAPKKGKGVNEAAEPLAWHKEGGDAKSTMADTYLDTSNGTEIGSGAPFEKGVNDHSEVENGTVDECTAMHAEGENQNSPKPGVGEIGDDAPFDKKVNEAEEGEEVLDDTEDADADVDFEGEEGEDIDLDGEDDIDLDTPEDGEDDIDVENLEDEDPFEDDELEGEEDDTASEIASLKDEIAQLKDMLSLVLDKVGADSEEVAEVEFDDDSLYDDDEDLEADEDFDDEDPFAGDDMTEDDDFESDDFEGEDFDDDDEFDEIHESKSYRRMKALREDKLDMFGKHPAFRKQIMTYPTNGEDKNKWGRDWNDDSVHGEEPYAQQIGSGAPFEVDPQAIENAIAESIKRVLGKK